jgi:hypothetical protein
VLLRQQWCGSLEQQQSKETGVKQKTFVGNRQA